MPEHLIIALARSIVQFQPSGMKCVADFIELYIKDLGGKFWSTRVMPLVS